MLKWIYVMYRDEPVLINMSQIADITTIYNVGYYQILLKMAYMKPENAYLIYAGNSKNTADEIVFQIRDFLKSDDMLLELWKELNKKGIYQDAEDT